jgi:metal-responsive CopG/Arc/MetJ family transcriptional regulator
MHRTQILLEQEQHKALTAIARRENRSLSDVVREMLQKQLEERKKMELTEAAKALLPDYQGDSELTAFTALDAEDFHA